MKMIEPKDNSQIDSMHQNLYNSALIKEIESGKEAEYLIEKYVLHNIPYFFKDKMDLYFELKKEISNKFSVPVTNIFLVGSGQFGFSLVTKKDFRDFVEESDSDNIEPSDLDFAIISTKLFDDIWDQLYDFSLNNHPYTKNEVDKLRDFKNYLFKGWIRPDKFPYDFNMKKDWFEFFNSLNSKVNRQVTCGVFRNESCFIKKYKQSLEELIKKVKGV